MARRELQLTVQEQLRQAIQGSELTVYAIAKLTGISHQQISRFAKAERGLTLGSFTALAAALDLQLSPVAPVAGPVAAESAAVTRPVPVAEQPATIPDAELLDAIRSNTGRMTPAKLAAVLKTLRTSRQALTLGTFHDAIRRLRTAGKVELSPWTGAAYQLKDGEACLILGTEVMAFVSAC